MTRIVGILNVTPDSFSDGGRWEKADDAIAHAVAMREQGAALIDVGGESTRPGATAVTTIEEQRRIIPIVRELASRGIPISIDTKNAVTALAAIEAGAEVVNDVSGGLYDVAMGRVIAETGVTFIAMHWRGGADVEPQYIDVVSEVRSELRSRIAELIVAGVDPQQIVIDPGLGFSKDPEHNWQLLSRFSELASLGHGILIGASRKRFLGALLPDGAPTDERDLPTSVVSALSAQAGAWGVRVHDVVGTRIALEVVNRWENGARA